jgi:hypothetical protein
MNTQQTQLHNSIQKGYVREMQSQFIFLASVTGDIILSILDSIHGNILEKV